MGPDQMTLTETIRSGSAVFSKRDKSGIYFFEWARGRGGVYIIWWLTAFYSNY